MATGTNATTELDAVNTMLGAVFEAPVNTLEVAGIEDVAMAHKMLKDKVREVLVRGLANNVDREVILTPDSLTSQIPLPANVLRVDSEPTDGLDVAQRGGLLYDRTAHSFIFTRPVSCEVVYHLEWDDLPEHIKVPIVIMAARRFQKAILGSADKGVFDGVDELEARTILSEADAEVEDSNMLSDSWSVYSILAR